MPIVKLTQDFIETDLQCPNDKKRIEFCDIDLPGFILEVRSTSPGQGTYYVRYKDDAVKTRYIKIGRTKDITLTQARLKAKKLKAEISLGADPRKELNAKKAVPTFTEFFEKQYMPHAKQHKRTWKKDEEYFRLRLKKEFGDKCLNQIIRQQIQTFHTGLKEEGLAAATCNHYVKLIKHALNLAVEWEILEKNPAAGFKLFREENMVENYLNDEELKRLLTVLRNDENRNVCRIILFLLSTGARLNEVLRATWINVDLERRVWRIPAQNSKSKKMRSVPLNNSAINVLEQLDSKCDYVFLSKTGKPFSTIQKVWQRLRALASLDHVRIHDLRHSYASMLINDGRTLYEVQQILGHSNPKVTQRYSHLSSKSLQSAANSASDRIKGVMKIAS